MPDGADKLRSIGGQVDIVCKQFEQRLLAREVPRIEDYLAGVEQACQEFVSDKPENLIELTTTQCMIIKLPTNT